MTLLIAIAGLAFAQEGTSPATRPTFDVALSAIDFDAYEGRPVLAVLVDEEGHALRHGRTTIDHGGFSLSWQHAAPAQWRLVWWVDLDADGACGRGEPAYLTVLDETWADVSIQVDADRAEADRNPYACAVVEEA